MITPEFLSSIAGLALLDSLNPATTVTVTLILLAAPKRAGLTALSVVIGAAATVFAVGATIFLSAGAAAGAVDSIVLGLRYLAFGAAGAFLIYRGVKRFRDRERKVISLPAWISPRTALPAGVILTAADLPNAFPYFIAIERMIASDVTASSGLLILIGYAFIYCVPCLILLLVGTLFRDVTKKWLEKLVAKLGTGPIKRSIPMAVATIALGIAVGSIPFVLL